MLVPDSWLVTSVAVKPNPHEQNSNKLIENQPFSDPAWFDWHSCRCSKSPIIWTASNTKWYLQCTESVPANEVAEPILLLFATHLYCPLSDRWTFCIVKKWTFSVFDWLRSGSAVMLSAKLSFVQWMLGSGFPCTVQLKIVVFPSIFTVLTGCLVNPGASGRGKVQDYYSGRDF